MSNVRIDVPTQPRRGLWVPATDPDALKLLDVGLILACGLGSGFVYSLVALGRAGDRAGHLAVAVIVAAIFVLVANQRGLYQPDASRHPGGRPRQVALIWSLTFLFLTAVAFGLKIGADFSRGFILVFAATGLVVLCGQRALLHAAVRKAEARDAVRLRPVYVLAPREQAARGDLGAGLGRLGLGVSQTFTWDGGEDGAREAASRLVASARGSQVEEIVLAADMRTWRAVRDVLRGQPLPVRLIPEAGVAELVRRPSMSAGDLTLVEIQRGPLSIAERRAKRALDVVIATVGLVALLPLLALVCVAIKLDSPGPIVFRQTRHGFNGRKFKIFKFRSMRVQEDGGVVRQASRNDSRVTADGRWLRRSSIDELPQLINVLRGEMSIVGPRPHAITHDTFYDNLIANYAWRHHVKPGLTGWAQLKGYRGETREVEDMARRVEHDIWYVDHCSAALDIRIIAGTFLQLVKTKNAY